MEMSTQLNQLHDEMYFHNDQPTTCPKCGNRTELIFSVGHLAEFGEVHQCMSDNCKMHFVAAENINEEF